MSSNNADLEQNNLGEPFLAIPRVGRKKEMSKNPDGDISDASVGRSSWNATFLVKVLISFAVVYCGFYQACDRMMGTLSSSTNIATFPSLLTLTDAEEDDDKSPSWLSKKFHPPHKRHHGRVVYKTTDVPGKGRIYTREFTSACAYGILVFSIGAAHNYLPYEFDIYHDEYAYSDNGGMCLLLPSYKGVESRKDEPYWNPSDPTQIVVNFKVLTKISTRIPKIHDGKPLNDHALSRCGDYVVMMKGNFYSAEFYQNLKHRINEWKVNETIEEIMADVVATTTTAQM